MPVTFTRDMDGVALRTGPLLSLQLRIEFPYLFAINLNNMVGHPMRLIRRLGPVFDVGICHVIAPFGSIKLNSRSSLGLHECADFIGADIDVVIAWLDAGV